MGKNKQLANKPVAAAAVKSPEINGRDPRSPLKWLGILLLLTLIAYLPVFSDQKEFTNWDDDGYITNQPLVKDPDIAKVFNPANPVMLNYHPLTILSLAIDYKLGFNEEDSTLSVTPFAVTNLLLHLLNTALVFIFLYRLGGRRLWVAVLPAVVFGLHPMHVESVAWLSERKDVLYCFFFLLSCIAYLSYLETKKLSLLALSFILFLASCLSKAMAVPLPFVLLLTDYLYRRRFTLQVWLEKVPYFIAALILGYIAVGVQSGAMSDAQHFRFSERLMYAAYGFCMYWIKLFAPIGLSALYPYPADGNISLLHYLSPVILLALLLLPLYFTRKRPMRFREVVWGMGVFTVMIALVSQFVSVGQAIMADRYSYVSYIGPLFIAGVFVQDLVENPSYKKLTQGIALAFVTVCAVLTCQRVAVWHNSQSLWADVIEKYPYEFNNSGKVSKRGVKTAYKNMGDYYTAQQMYDSAFFYYGVLTTAGTTDAEVWSNLGSIYTIKNDLPGALSAYKTSLGYDSLNFETFMKRSVVYVKTGNFDGVLTDMDRVIKLKPGFEDAYVKRTRALLSLKRYDNAIAACNAILKKDSANAEIWACKGIANVNLQNYEVAVSDVQRAIQINPGSGFYYYNLAFAYNKMGKKQDALVAAKQAQQAGFAVPPQFMKSLSE